MRLQVVAPIVIGDVQYDRGTVLSDEVAAELNPMQLSSCIELTNIHTEEEE